MSLLRLVKQSKPDENTSSSTAQIIPVTVLRHLLSALHFRDINTLRHSRRVGLISVGIASRLGWENKELRMIEMASLLHDVGKLGIPDHIIHKPGKLSPDEADYIAIFHKVGVELLQACQVHPKVVEVIAQSHTNNSDSIKEFSLGSRILAVSDAYDSLTTTQTFRAAFSREEAMKILEEQAGKRFDRNVVSALSRWLDSPDASVLQEERAGYVAMNTNGIVDEETQTGAALICQLFSYLYTLESLYEAFYFVDTEQKIVIWSAGAVKLFGKSAKEMIGQRWKRSLVSQLKQSLTTDALDKAFHTGQPQCHRMRPNTKGNDQRELDVQALPILDENNNVAGVAELLCDGTRSKRNSGQFRELQLAATKDALTGVLNRGELDGQIKLVHQRWEANPGTKYSVVFFDLDHFKAINDRLSHSVGDQVLIDVAQLVEDELYSGEIIGRYGGEEFVVLCPETELDHAIERAERLRRLINSSNFADREDLRVTASFGVAQVEPGDKMAEVVKRADEALYDAKHSGRNRTCSRSVSPNTLASSKSESKLKQWVLNSEITAQVTADLLPMKLAGFVEDNFSRIVSVTKDKVIINVGKSGFLSGWGSTPHKQPIRLTMEIHEPPADAFISRNKRILLKVVTTPISKPSSPDAFQNRALHVIETLRSYLIAD